MSIGRTWIGPIISAGVLRSEMMTMAMAVAVTAPIDDDFGFFKTLYTGWKCKLQSTVELSLVILNDFVDFQPGVSLCHMVRAPL